MMRGAHARAHPDCREACHRPQIAAGAKGSARSRYENCANRGIVEKLENAAREPVLDRLRKRIQRFRLVEPHDADGTVAANLDGVLLLPTHLVSLPRIFRLVV